jgi:hypothetical protein
MKKLFIVVSILFAFVLVGCFHTEKICCPNEDVIFFLGNGMPVKMKKGFLDKEAKGGNWESVEQFNKDMKDSIKRYRGF